MSENLDLDEVNALNAMKPCSSENAKSEGAHEAVEKGLTMQFRQSIVYKKMVADILKLSPNASSFEIDTAIWWYISYPQMFESEEGKSLIEGMKERTQYYTDPNYKESDDDFVSRQYPISKHRPESVRDDSGVDPTHS
jgi:hypothetical protein